MNILYALLKLNLQPLKVSKFTNTVHGVFFYVLPSGRAIKASHFLFYAFTKWLLIFRLRLEEVLFTFQ